MISSIIRLFSNKKDTPADHPDPVETPAASPETAYAAIVDTVKNLIAAGETGQAIQWLHENGYDMALIRAQWESAFKQYEKGRIEFKEWVLVQNRINFSLLEIFNIKSPQPDIPAAPPAPPVQITQQDRDKVSQMLSEGRLQEAVEYVKKFGRDFILTAARYQSLRRNYLLGMVSEAEWAEQQERIAEAILGFTGVSNKS